MPYSESDPAGHEESRVADAMNALDGRWNHVIFWYAGMPEMGEAQESLLHAAAVSQARSKNKGTFPKIRVFLDHWEAKRGDWKDKKFPSGPGDYQMISVLMSELAATESYARQGGYVVPAKPKLPKWEGFDESASFREAVAIDEAAKGVEGALREQLPGGDKDKPYPWYLKYGIKAGLVVGAAAIGYALIKKPFAHVRRIFG